MASPEGPCTEGVADPDAGWFYLAAGILPLPRHGGYALALLVTGYRRQPVGLASLHSGLNRSLAVSIDP